MSAQRRAESDGGPSKCALYIVLDAVLSKNCTYFQATIVGACCCCCRRHRRSRLLPSIWKMIIIMQLWIRHIQRMYTYSERTAVYLVRCREEDSDTQTHRHTRVRDYRRRQSVEFEQQQRRMQQFWHRHLQVHIQNYYVFLAAKHSAPYRFPTTKDTIRIVASHARECESNTNRLRWPSSYTVFLLSSAPFVLFARSRFFLCLSFVVVDFIPIIFSFLQLLLVVHSRVCIRFVVPLVRSFIERRFALDIQKC